MPTMPRKLLKYVQMERDRHGVVRFYFRKGKGKRIALPDIRDKKAHEAAYAEALAETGSIERKAQSGTMAWLIDRYKQSAHFANLKPSTRRMRDNILKRVAEESGQVPFAAITRKHINEAIDRRPPHAGNTFRKVMGQMFKWALSVELVEVNPVTGANRHKVDNKGHHTWTVAEVEQFCRYWPVGTRERLAMDMLLFTGLRRSDVYRVGRQHVSDNVISITMRKTSKPVYVPIFAALRASMDAAPTGDLAFLVTSRGLPFSSEASFGNWFAKACREAGVPGRAHGLRKAGATIAAEAGATAHELMAMYGWKNLEEAELYTREADRKRLSAVAAERIANAFAPHLNPPKKIGGK